MPDPIEVEVTVECPSHCQGAVACSVCGSAGEPGTVTAALTGRDALVYEAGQSTLEMLWIAGYRHDSPDFEVRSQQFRLTDAAREWLWLKAADAALKIALAEAPAPGNPVEVPGWVEKAATVNALRQALGLLSTLAPHVEVDASDPVKMAHAIVAAVTEAALLAGEPEAKGADAWTASDDYWLDRENVVSGSDRDAHWAAVAKLRARAERAEQEAFTATMARVNDAQTQMEDRVAWIESDNRRKAQIATLTARLNEAVAVLEEMATSMEDGNQGARNTAAQLRSRIAAITGTGEVEP